MLMIQNNGQHQMKSTKVKLPPPVPPRPNQSLVAEALAKTRRAVVESRANITKSYANSRENQKQLAKAKTLERANSTGPSSASPSPKQNGLARVKSFIRDVISDRSSSSDERRSSGQNSRRSSSDSSSIPTPSSLKKSNESLNSKAVKTCKQILVRSLSSSNKLEPDKSKSKVIKSSSFADKTIPIRKAPPPPLSPKPKLRPLRPLPIRQNAVDDRSPKQSPDVSPYASPVDAKSPPRSPRSPLSEAPYATVEEVQDFDDSLRNSPSRQDSCPSRQENGTSRQDSSSSGHSCENVEKTNGATENNNYNSLERKTSRVTERLISEIIASRNNKNQSNTVIDKGKESGEMTNGKLEPELDILHNKDMNNHEMLIYELQTMHSQSSVPEALDSKDIAGFDKCESESSEPNYALSSESSGTPEDDQSYAYILDDDLKSRLRKQYRAISTMSLQGLPPLPKSLSGFADNLEPEDTPSGTPEKPPTDLDGQLAYLKKEMASLRQLDLSLLSELWSLSEAMAAWRRQLERGPRLRPAPPPPPPPPPHYLRT